MRTHLILLASAALLGACANPMPTSTPPSSTLTLDKLDGTRWVATEFAGSERDGRKPTLNFAVPGAARVTGFGGCNNYFGDAKMEGDQLRIGPLAQSMMMCEDAAMKIERTVQQRLDQTRSARRDGARLVLLNAAGGELMRLDPAP